MQNYAAYELSTQRIPNKINPRLIKLRDIKGYSIEDAKLKISSTMGKPYDSIRVIPYK